MNSLQIRQKFLDFFKKNGHTIVPSSSLIPAEDPTLLFANAGMNQFKDVFLGKEERPYKRAASIQKCVRAGGKHNDLDQVGFTERHLTFFEMMGNFSFGDYFKKEAIKFAWDFLTKEMGLPKDKLYISVYKKDDEAFQIWNKEIGIPENKISRLGEKDNFWQMGETGPCGPCTEIYLDRGSEKSCGKSSCTLGCDCARYFEIWNNVFMQFNRSEDGTLTPLSKTGVDTGMGLERLCMAMQNKDTVFEIDIFEPLIRKIEQITNHNYEKGSTNLKAAFNVLIDHIRSSCLIIADGCTPSNEGRGYVLRKIIRRAALFAQKLSDNPKLFPMLGEEFILIMSPIYPELKKSESLIIKLLTTEIDKFSTNLIQGKSILLSIIENNLAKGKKIIEGPEAFKLYDTYGFPVEITRVIAHENDFTVDIDGFEEEMKKQQEQSGKKHSKHEEIEFEFPQNLETKFVGYETLEASSKILFSHNGANKTFWIITSETPFYVECGGQVNDQGFVSINNVTYPIVNLKKVGKAIAVQINLKDIENYDPGIINIKEGDIAHQIVDNYARTNTVRNHTATHLLQAALMQILGSSVKQAGSIVEPDYLRFDFTHYEALTKEQINQIENLVNQKIQDDIKTKIYETSLEKAKDSGVISFFGEKYNPEKVRVVEVPGFSAELCGGTHASSTGIIGSFKIISETALSSGVRRITAVTGPEALKIFQQTFNTIKALSEQYKVKQENVLEAVMKQQTEIHKLHGDIKQLRKQLIKFQISLWTSQISQDSKIPFLYLELDGIESEELKHIAQEIEKKVAGLFLLISKQTIPAQKVSFVAYLSKKFENQLDMKDFLNFLKQHGLSGGGSKTILQGGGILKTNIKNDCEIFLKNK